MHPENPPRSPDARRDWLAAVALAGVAFAAFAPALGCGFVNLDDPTYVVDNRNVTDGLNAEGVRWAFTTFSNTNWHPLTWLSLQLDASLWGWLWGPGPFNYHLTNVLLHAANAALLFLALRSLTGAFWRSAAVALLFAVHPLRVESVAWVSERKDVLSACFGLVALWAYAGYAKALSGTRSLLVCVALYLLVWGALALSLLAKPMLVTLPCLLLVLDWWPLRRARASGDWRRLAAEKLPLFALAAASAAFTYHAQAAEGAVSDLERFPLVARLENAAVSYVAYLAKTLWPEDLAVYYPHPAYASGTGGGLLAWEAAGALLLLGAVTAGAAALRGRAPYLLAGWLWYVGTLVPVIGLVQVGGQAYADRYTYLPQVGLLLAACWGAADLAGDRTRAALAGAGVVAAVLMLLTWNQVRFWDNSLALWEHTCQVTAPTPMSLANLGHALEEHGRVDRAITCYEKALQLDENSAPTRSNLGNLLLRQGKVDEAALQWEKVCSLTPDQSDAWCSRGRAEMMRNKFADAEACYHKALALQPGSAEAHSGLGFALLRQEKTEEAVAELREAVDRDPRSAQSHTLLAKALEIQGDAEGSARHLEEAVRLDPARSTAWYDLGSARLRAKQPAEAADCFERAADGVTRSLARNPRSPLFQRALNDALDGLAAARDLAAAAGRRDLAGQIEQRLRRYKR